MARTFDPFRSLDDWFGSAAPMRTSVGMPMDLFRDGEVFVARIDLPGVDPSTIDIDVEDRTLTVRGERRAPAGGDAQWLMHERQSGTFARQPKRAGTADSQRRAGDDASFALDTIHGDFHSWSCSECTTSERSPSQGLTWKPR